MVDDGEDDVGDVLFAVDGEFEHGVIGLDTEFAARQFQIAFLIGGIHADRNGIQDAAAKVRCRIAAIGQVGQAVGIDAGLHAGMRVFDVFQEGRQIIEAFCRFAEAAEDDFVDVVPGSTVESFLHFIHRRFPLQPQCLIFGHLLHGPQTERTGTGAAIGQVDVHGPLSFRLHLQAIFEIYILSLSYYSVNNHDTLSPFLSICVSFKSHRSVVKYSSKARPALCGKSKVSV